MKSLILFVACLVLFAAPVLASDAPPTVSPENVGSTNGAQFEVGWNYLRAVTGTCNIGQVLNEIQADGGSALEATEIWVWEQSAWKSYSPTDTTKISQDTLLAFNSNQKFFFDLNPDVCAQNNSKRQAEIEKIRKSGNKNWLDATLTGIKNQILSPFGLKKDIDISSIAAESATFSDSLKVIGKTQLADTTIGGSLIIGLLHLDDVKAEISSLTGQVTINSNLNVMGDATVSGQLHVEKGIVLKDKTTSENYCMQIDKGEIVKNKGNCN